MKRILHYALVLTTISTFAQAPAIQWQKCYGGTGEENANAIAQTTDGGYIMAGYTNSVNGDITSNHGGNDYWVVKTDSAGTIEWQKTYGGTADDQAHSVIQTADGGYIVAGYSDSSNGDITNTHGDKDFWIVKLDNAGSIEWQHKYGGDDKEFANEIRQTADGGYIIAGKTYSYDGVIMPVNGDITNFHGGTDGWLLKISSTGAIEWQKCLGTDSLENFQSVQQTADGGYVVAGEYGNGHSWVRKCDSIGNLQWDYFDVDSDVVFSIKQTADGGYILAADAITIIANVEGHNFEITKLNARGGMEWKKSYGGDGFFDSPRSIEITPEGGYVATGVTDSNYSGNVGPSNGLQDIWIIKLNAAGTLQWQKCLGGSSYDGASEIKVTADHGYIVSGFAQSTNGNVTGNHGGRDLWTVKLASDPLALEDFKRFKDSISFYPNPAKDKIAFSEMASVIVFSANGSKILSLENTKEINISSFAKGLYMLKLTTNNRSSYQKLVKE